MISFDFHRPYHTCMEGPGGLCLGFVMLSLITDSCLGPPRPQVRPVEIGEESESKPQTIILLELSLKRHGTRKSHRDRWFSRNNKNHHVSLLNEVPCNNVII